jgi:hypothetical protein
MAMKAALKGGQILNFGLVLSTAFMVSAHPVFTNSSF